MSDPLLDIPEELRRRRFDLHVICNSHLDREWTEDFQFTRALTVQFIDSLLNIMRRSRDYQFLMDSQTIPLEDYLEVRPENEQTLRSLVREGRLSVGPWYTAPDCSCLSGESIVRNLLIGHRIARDFGKVLKIGYTPFGFGQVSQLPQIYAGFGIDVIWFYRGVTEREVPGVCFRWVGADGTKVFCSRAQRYNYYFGVMRPLIKGGGLLDRDYDYTSTQTPIHFCDDRRTNGHALLADSQTLGDLSTAPQLIADLVKASAEIFPGSVISFMNGMDTSMPSPLDDQVIKYAQDKLPEGWRIFHSNLADFIDAFRTELEDSGVDLPVVRGERRDAGFPHREAGMLGDIITARPLQKLRNAEAETSLQRYAEPLATIAWILGADYPATLLDCAWKELCKCHPHDTIAGAGLDQIERDMLNRLDKVQSICETQMQFSMGSIINRVNMSDVGESEVPLVVFNPSMRRRSEILHAHVDIPDDFEFDGLELVDLESESVVECYTISWRTGGQRVVRDAQDAPTSFYCVHAEIDFVAQDIPPLGYRTYVLRKAERKGWHRTLATGSTTLDNPFIRATVAPDGTVELQDKQTGRVYPGLHYFRDRGEAGNAWTSFPPTDDREVVSLGTPTRVSIDHDSPLRARIKVEHVLRIPARLVANDDFTWTGRSADEVDLPIVSYFTLTRDSRALDVRTVIENRAECHTLQVMFPTGLDATVSESDTAFDVVERGIDRDEDHSYAQVINPTHPMLRFASVSETSAGLAIANVGIRGYEVTDDSTRSLGLTLLRAFEVYLCTVSWRWERRSDQKLSQALGRHEYCYAIVPHSGTWRGAVAREAERINVPMLIVQTGRHDGDLPPVYSFLEVTPSDIELSAIKKAEASEDLIVRLFNPTREQVDVRITLGFEIAFARRVSLEEQPVEDVELAVNASTIALALGPKKIVTLQIGVKRPTNASERSS